MSTLDLYDTALDALQNLFLSPNATEIEILLQLKKIKFELDVMIQAAENTINGKKSQDAVN